jgi:hypothetical protein
LVTSYEVVANFIPSTGGLPQEGVTVWGPENATQAWVKDLAPGTYVFTLIVNFEGGSQLTPGQQTFMVA